ncbi:hypothetical protein [Streptomyces indicus]|uniref:Uncharacterized protein n=1 Tax=Streptomyces indicus TaxID=417292 RepID=A0A1G9A8T4_9ACTN|nr:hypothetical protein SAMN05421806_105430 [Streptomyces indicus]
MDHTPAGGGTPFESMSHDETLRWLDQANSGGVQAEADRLAAAAKSIREIAAELKICPQHVEWKGEGASAFRTWSGDLANVTLRLGDYREAASQWLTRASDAIAEAQTAITAPGEQIVQACAGMCREDRSLHRQWTSSAIALASASAALIWSKHPAWEKRNAHIGYGIVRPRIAHKSSGDHGPADECPLPDLAETPKPESPQPAVDDKQAAADTPPEKTEESQTPWPVLTGLRTAVIIAGGAGLAVARHRRRTA